MTNADGNSVSPAPDYDPDSSEVEVVLEGHLMKQASRSRHTWRKRYFVFCSDQQLSCFHRQGDSMAKSTYRITRESGCQISDMFVQRVSKGTNKAEYYCITITWPEDATSATTAGEINKALRDDTSHDSITDSPVNRRGLDRTFSNPSLLSPGRAHSFDSSDGGTRPPSRGLPSFVSRSKKNKPPLERQQTDGGENASPAHHRRQRSLTRLFKRSHSYEEVYDSKDKGSEDSVCSSKKGKRFSPKSAIHIRRKTFQGNEPGIPSIVNMNLIDPPPLISVAPSGGTAAGQSSDPTFRTFSPQNHEEKTDLDPSHHAQSRVSGANGKDQTADRPDNKLDDEQNQLLTQYRSNRKEKTKRSRQKVIDGTKYAAAAGAAVGITFLTSGLGLVAGAALLGITAAAGGTAVGAEAGMNRKKNTTKLTLATTNFDKAKEWKSTLDSCLQYESVKESTWGQMFIAEGRKTSTAFFSHERGDGTKSRNIDFHMSPKGERKVVKQFVLRKRPVKPFLRDGDIPMESSSRWVPLEGGWTSLLGSGSQGLRVFREERINDSANPGPAATGGSSSATMKAQVVVNANPLDAFMCLMSVNRIPSSVPGNEVVPGSGRRSSFQVLEKIDDNTDIIHLVCRALYLFPSMTSPRDFVLFRYWRHEPDGSYIVCFDSTDHTKCSPRPDYVRGDLHQVLTIAPRRKTRNSSGNQAECLITSVVQVDPKGWIPHLPLSFLSRQGYSDAFGISALLDLLDIRDAIDLDRFLDVSPDMYDQTYSPAEDQEVDPASKVPPNRLVRSESINYDLRYANRERLESQNLDSNCIESHPPPLLSHKWAEPDANTFLVRGPNYIKDKMKVNAGTSIGRLLAVDIVIVDKPIYGGMSKHPGERIQQALRREEQFIASGRESDMPPFIFVVNIILPGPPFHHGVFYFGVDDISTIDGSDGSGSSALCSKFLFGDSDEFRDKTFKLIPQIVQGNFMVRKAVGSTPAIMGTKLKQTYVREKRFMEVILDCGSSAVATGVIRLSLGYAKTLMVDMAFLLEGHDEATLPERVFGCVRVKFPEFGPHLRKVEQP